MATIRICDKCKKRLKESFWNNSENYNVGVEEKILLDKKLVLVRVNISLENGQNLDLCDDCGWKIVRKKTAKSNG